MENIHTPGPIALRIVLNATLLSSPQRDGYLACWLLPDICFPYTGRVLQFDADRSSFDRRSMSWHVGSQVSWRTRCSSAVVRGVKSFRGKNRLCQFSVDKAPHKATTA